MRALSSSPEAEHLGAMSLVDHLRELRSRLIKCLVAVALAGTVMWWLYLPVIHWLTTLLVKTCPAGQACRIIQTEPLQGLSTRFSICAYGGVALAMPVLLWQLWRFVTPGLYKRERRLAVPFVASAVLLFIGGAALAIAIMPAALKWLTSTGGSLDQLYTPDKYVMFVVKVALGFGIGFELPIVLIFLQLLGLLTPAQLGKWRRYAVVAIIVLVALGPTGDPVSLLVQSVPMYLLYEVSILVGRLFARRKRKRAAA